MTIAFFDFDHTLTTKDSMVRFVKFHKGQKLWYSFILKKVLLLVKYKLQLVSGKIAKEALLTYFYKDVPEEELITWGNNFAKNKLNSILNTHATAKLKWHLANKHKVVIVTASLPYWISAWAEQYNIDIISSKAEVIDNKLSGKLDGENCNYQEKVSRINLRYNLSEYKEVYAYGNSKGDIPMLEMATKPFYRKFN